MRAWFERHHPVGLQIVAAETLPYGSIKRIRYVSSDGAFMDEGVGAVARAFEHIHPGYALLGAVMRLPGLRQLIQAVLDAAGFGPRIPGEASSCALPEK
ncbi:MAG: hypothetical protein JSS87_05170 [Acidobacteria bacterium]|nr:hypothetical protein [Acidobacteriota bacterium]